MTDSVQNDAREGLSGRRIMLTGATGFIGSHLAERLLREEAELSLFSRRSTPFLESLAKNGAKLHIGSAHDTAALTASMEEADTVIHCAGATRAFSEAGFMAANAEFTARICENMPENARFMLISSQAAAGPSLNGQAVLESDPPHPVSRYGRSKLEAERRVAAILEPSRYAVLRPAVVYGPRERDLLQAFRMAKYGLCLGVGSPLKKVSIVHVFDLIDAILRVFKTEFAGNTYFAAHPEPASWEGVAGAICSALGSKCRVVCAPVCLANAYAQVLNGFCRLRGRPPLINPDKISEMREDAWLCDPSRLQSETGWQPEYSLQDGIRATAEWYRAEGWL